MVRMRPSGLKPFGKLYDFEWPDAQGWAEMRRIGLWLWLSGGGGIQVVGLR